MPKTKDWGSPYGKPDRPQPRRASRRVLVPMPQFETYLSDHGTLITRVVTHWVEKFEPLKADTINRLFKRAQEVKARKNEAQRIRKTYREDAW